MAISTEALIGIVAVSIAAVPIGISVFKCCTRRRRQYNRPDVENTTPGFHGHQRPSQRPHGTLDVIRPAEDHIAMPLLYHGSARPLRVDTVYLNIQAIVSQSNDTSRFSTV
ncbi:hypothetical protein ASPCAL09050 [Aspergillus calidoustus]|uniref:Uncharacterized protein n=1 Tax=Aspergillus calidoustus TaxID=454130 RepID=A0A0U5GT87_ASPCI|nr:hypothetical protein ASPCAL09050 [Aspergillus calidoustus]